MHEVHGLRRGDVAFFRGATQLLLPAQWVLADRVEVRFRSSKGDQFRKGAVVTRARSGVIRQVEASGGAVDIMVELGRALVPLHLPPVVRASSRFWCRSWQVGHVDQTPGDDRPPPSGRIGGFAARGVCAALPADWGGDVLGGGGGVAGRSSPRGAMGWGK